MSIDPVQLWRFLLVGYPLTVLLELPVLWWCLHPSHPRRRKLFSAFWLTACSYPIVILVLPILLQSQTRWVMVAVAEVVAPASECVLFLGAFGLATWRRDVVAVVAANLLSFGVGELLHAEGFFELFAI